MIVYLPTSDDYKCGDLDLSNFKENPKKIYRCGELSDSPFAYQSLEDLLNKPDNIHHVPAPRILVADTGTLIPYSYNGCLILNKSFKVLREINYEEECSKIPSENLCDLGRNLNTVFTYRENTEALFTYVKNLQKDAQNRIGEYIPYLERKHILDIAYAILARTNKEKYRKDICDNLKTEASQGTDMQRWSTIYYLLEHNLPYDETESILKNAQRQMYGYDDLSGYDIPNLKPEYFERLLDYQCSNHRIHNNTIKSDIVTKILAKVITTHKNPEHIRLGETVRNTDILSAIIEVSTDSDIEYILKNHEGMDHYNDLKISACLRDWKKYLRRFSSMWYVYRKLFKILPENDLIELFYHLIETGEIKEIERDQVAMRNLILRGILTINKYYEKTKEKNIRENLALSHAYFANKFYKDKNRLVRIACVKHGNKETITALLNDVDDTVVNAAVSRASKKDIKTLLRDPEKIKLNTAQTILRQGEREYYTALAKSSNPYIKELALMTLYEPALKILAKNYLHDVTAWRAYAYLKTGKLPPAR